MYPYHNKIKQRIKNGELIGFEFAEDWPKIGSCLLLRFNTLPAVRPIRAKRFGEYATILKQWAEQKFSGAAAQVKPTGRKLSELALGETFKIGEYEFVVLEHCAGETAMILKGILKKLAFGSNNNFDGSAVDEVCLAFGDEIANIVGEENLVPHTVDLTSDDGLKDYGEVERSVSLLTTEQYRRWVKILDRHRPDSWWWLSTPHSTQTHENTNWVKCVSPVGNFYYYHCGCDFLGVRPFCIFKSSIFGS